MARQRLDTAVTARPATVVASARGALGALLEGRAWFVVRLALAWLHTFPARKHLAELAVAPSLDEAWKGLGALMAVLVFLLPIDLARRALRSAGRWTGVLTTSLLVLAIVHLVPAMDHLPRWVVRPSFSDGWRGLGAAAATTAFLFGGLRQLARAQRVRRPSPQCAIYATHATKRPVREGR